MKKINIYSFLNIEKQFPVPVFDIETKSIRLLILLHIVTLLYVQLDGKFFFHSCYSNI
jgi:hypothetical protein